MIMRVVVTLVLGGKILLACVRALGEVLHFKDRDPFNLGDSQLSLMSSLPPPHLNSPARDAYCLFSPHSHLNRTHSGARVSICTCDAFINIQFGEVDGYILRCWGPWCFTFCATRVCGSHRSFNFHHSPQLCLRARATVCVLGTHLHYTYPFVQVLVIA